MRHPADWWAGVVTELEATGDVRAVARRHRVHERTLIWWRAELRRRSRSATTPRLLPVVVSEAARRAIALPSCGGIEVFVEVGAARITLRGAVAAEHITAVITAAAGSC